MTTEESSHSPELRRYRTIRTSRPNLDAPVHKSVPGRQIELSTAQMAARTALEEAWRNPQCLTKIARRCARRRGCDVDELLSESVVHALAKDIWEPDILKRLEGIISSKSSSFARSRHRERASGRELVSIDEIKAEKCFAAIFPATLTPHEVTLRNAEQHACAKVIEAITGGDASLVALVDGIDRGLQGEELRKLLNVSLDGLAALRKRLKRRAAMILATFVIDGRIDVDLLAQRF